MRIRTRRDSPLIADVAVSRITASQSDRVELAWSLHDVTERRQFEEGLSRSQDELEMCVQERTADLEASREQALMLARRLVEMQETERVAIARELHDEAGQTLSALIIGLAAIRKEVIEPASVATRAAELQQIADGTMEGLHRLAMRLRPVGLDRGGLTAALTQQMQTFKQQNLLNVQLVILGLDDERLPGETEVTVYRVVQEALTNVARHARAQSVGVIVERQRGLVKAIIEDDGLGFDVDEALSSGRLGLVGMRERLEVFGGKLTIESAPGKGTTVFAEVPIDLLALKH